MIGVSVSTFIALKAHRFLGWTFRGTAYIVSIFVHLTVRRDVAGHIEAGFEDVLE